MLGQNMLLQKLSQKTFKYMCHLCELISLVIITQLTKDIFIVLCVCMLFVTVFWDNFLLSISGWHETHSVDKLCLGAVMVFLLLSFKDFEYRYATNHVNVIIMQWKQQLRTKQIDEEQPRLWDTCVRGKYHRFKFEFS